MVLSHEVTIFTGSTGMRLDEWDRYELALSMFSPGSPWTVTLFRSSRGESAWGRAWKNVRVGDKMVFAIDGAQQMNGLVEEITDPSDPVAGDSMVISGRDLAGPALKWHADPRLRLKGLTLEDALRQLFTPLGIGVRIGEGVEGTRAVQIGSARDPRSGRTTARRRQTVDYARPQPGETVWQVADALCRRFGYLLWVAPHPEEGLSVVVDVPDYTGEVYYSLRRILDPDRRPGEQRLTADTNVLTSARRLSVREVPTEVTVYTGSARGASLSARSTETMLNGGLFDPKVNGGYVVDEGLAQPMHLRAPRARTPAAARQTAQRAINDAMRTLRTYSCTVQGHGQPQRDGAVRLYTVNSLAHVVDEPRGIDERMLVQELAFRGDASEGGGSTTALTLGPLGAIVLSPEDP